MVESVAMAINHTPNPAVPATEPTETRRLPPAAERALAEAAARRAQIDAHVASLPPEKGARREREPVRYGDWEAKGLASDF